MNEVVELVVFIDPVWIECTHLKDEFLFLRFFTAFCVPVV